MVVAVTDSDWFGLLRKQMLLNEVNFWAPSDKNFRALQPGELFLFKLHAPINKIVDGGVFAFASRLPLSLAWESFGVANGATTLIEMRKRIAKYRRAGADDRSDFSIGCRILTQPFFFAEHDWLPVSVRPRPSRNRTTV
jgi:putative restriction endonuclease